MDNNTKRSLELQREFIMLEIENLKRLENLAQNTSMDEQYYQNLKMFIHKSAFTLRSSIGNYDESMSNIINEIIAKLPNSNETNKFLM